MTKAMKKCKVCGADYEYCHTVRSTIDIFRWQDVACCPEHGSEYFAKVLESRKTKEPENTSSYDATETKTYIPEDAIDNVEDMSDTEEDDEEEYIDSYEDEDEVDA